MDKDRLIHVIRHNLFRAKDAFKWVSFAICLGITLGVIGGAFYRCIAFVTEFRQAHPAILFLLPVGAALIILAYKYIGKEAGRGTNQVLGAIQEAEHIPLRMAPLIFVSTVFSHLLGASVGREGAALQMGGSVGEYMGAGFLLSKDDKKTMIMAGMSAAFSAVFGTPIAASVFSIEVVTVGLMHYEALLPSVIASFTARFVAAKLGANALSYELNVEPDFTPLGMLKVAGLSLLCGLISIVFCMAMHKGEEISKKGIPNDYIRSVIFGTSILVLSLIFNDQVYNGTGTEYIHLCLNGDTRSLGFLIKMVFTVLSILAGYKGGEIVPSFFMGASLGSLYGNLLGFSPELCAALGLSGMFCSVTNCPITSFLIFCELFGFDNAPYAMLTCALCYILSGYYGLYTGQDILYSKFRSSYINKKTK